MEKQTKNIITKKMIESKLDFLTKADIRASVLLYFLGFVVSFLVFGVIFGGAYAMWGHAEGIVLGAVGAVGLILLIGYFIKDVYGVISSRRSVKRGEIEVSIEALSYKAEEAEGDGRSWRLVRYFYFPSFSKTAVGNTEFQLASNGDEFYIVHYKGEDRAVLLYSLKRYEYKEE